MKILKGGRAAARESRPMSRARIAALVSVSGAALMTFSTAAYAQDATVEEVVVTATRLTASGFTAPTPTTVLGTEEIAQQAKPNIFNAIAQLPSLQGSTGAGSGNGGTSGGTNGLSSFNMRGLGPIRTLTLLDGQRVVPANVTGVPDISQFPQLLISRVDVVTGGASASYGSDAVAGVINFITDKKFEGFKYNLQGGLTNYGDGGNYAAQIAAGTSFAGGAGHIEASAEYGHEDGIGPNGFGAASGPNGRTWYKAPGLQIRPIGSTPAGQPQITPILFAQDYQFAKYGLITSGPLQGTAFGTNGQPFQFQYGSTGVPTGNGGVTNCVNPFCQGGDLSGNVGNGTSISADLTRSVFYTRASYNLTPSIELFASVNLAKVTSHNVPNPGAFKNANLTIQCANPFVPASIQAACAANNITSFQFGTSNAEFPTFLSVNPEREQYRYVVGANGSFDLIGKKWTWDTYYQYGLNNTLIQVKDITLTPRYNAAINAIAGPNGTIVCSSAAARASGCVPLNVLGNVPVSDATWRYIAPETGPFQRSRQREDAFAFTLNGEPFSAWAGPIAMAAGIEYRKESYTVRGDPYGNGATADDPYSAQYPADPVLNTAGNNWYAGNFHNGAGSYNVKEGFIEFGVPLLNSETFGKADLQLAGRATDYSTSGRVNTWKVGVHYNTPIQGVSLRAVRSRDARAPNLSELFAAPIVSNGTVIAPNGNSVTILNQAVGNPDLQAELGTTSEFGVVLQNPSWLPGFSASVDYYSIKVEGQISSLTAQQEVDLCAAGNAAICQSVFLTGTQSNPNFVVVKSFNLASVQTDGVDIEATYRFDLNNWNLPGEFTIRGLATHVNKFVQDPGVVGQIPRDLAGENSGSIPRWKVLGVQNWTGGGLTLSLNERWFSDGTINNNYIECTTGCPAPTVQHPTISDNKMKGAFYLDFGASYKFRPELILYAKIDNIFDRNPEPLYGAAPNNIGANAPLYDTYGRMYRIGLRGSF